MHLKLRKTVTPNELVKYGFRNFGNSKYVLRKYLFKEIIYIRIVITKEEKDYEIEYEVIDRNTESTYHPFYVNHNKGNNLVTEAVVNNFQNLVKEMENAGVLVKSKKNRREHV